ncbi:MAG TPA: hypothetical protein VGQ20_04790 [Acidimicrobiales bacterium]|jgi:ATP-binding cassette subfamily B protein|nr:hypothetical protein [Acidimicrobiales bacterium]
MVATTTGSTRPSVARSKAGAISPAGRRVVDAGSHADLVARGGLYAELYELQARPYG